METNPLQIRYSRIFTGASTSVEALALELAPLQSITMMFPKIGADVPKVEFKGFGHA
jgi:hypothetical protein